MIHALALCLMAAVPQAAPQAVTIDVRVADRDGQPVVTIHARRADLEALVMDVAAKSGRSVHGTEWMRGTAPIDVELVDRPLNQALQIVLGATGLRARLQGPRIEIEREQTSTATPEELDERAMLTYLAALRSFPAGESADDAEFALAGIEERRGNRSAARAHYDALVSRHADSKHAPVALLRAGAILQDEGEWIEASARFSKLASAPVAHTHHALARLELARSLAHAGDGRQALSILDALDRLFPPIGTPEGIERSFVRAEATLASGLPGEALVLLDEVLGRAPERCANADVLELRAEALERLGSTLDAARVRLVLAGRVEGKRREAALERAAALALAAGDALGARFVEKSAAGANLPPQPPPEGTDAVPDLEDDHAPSVDERLKLAAEHCQLGEFASAQSTIEPLWSVRTELEERDRLRATLVRARCVDASSGPDAAIELLRESLDGLRDPEHRRQVYLFAGEIHERGARWDLAVEAYGGRL